MLEWKSDGMRAKGDLYNVHTFLHQSQVLYSEPGLGPDIWRTQIWRDTIRCFQLKEL